MYALHFGAGNIGRGFIGKRLLDSGFNLTFVDINMKVIDLINKFHSYDIEVVENSLNYIDKVTNVNAIHIHDKDILLRISQVNLITISVGINFIYSLANLLAKGIKYKIDTKNFTLLTIIACENIFRCTSRLKHEIKKCLSNKYHKYLEQNVDFIDSVVDRIVFSNIHNNYENNALLVKVEEFNEWIVDLTQFRSSIHNSIIDLICSDNLDAFFERKLFTINTGHSIIAYLGFLKKYNNIYQSISDSSIYNIVLGAMKESGLVLVKKYKLFSLLEHNKYIERVLLRFQNIFLTDSLNRVGRNPLKKLAKNDRLISPLLGTLKYNISNANLLKGIAASLCFFDDNDNESIRLQKMIFNYGPEYVLKHISELDMSSWVVSEINIYFNIFKNLNNR
ncbi:MAG: mannitol-1-phosphate 5-dehydrogenase [Buchnera aphidicola (Chaetogeoica yunlongensis)]